MKYIADLPIFPPSKPGFRGFGTLGLDQVTSSDPNTVASEGIRIFAVVLSSAVGIITFIGILWFVFNTTLGAVGLITGAGDKNKIAESRSKIIMGLVGLVVTISAIFLIQLFGILMGINVLDIKGIIESLKI